MTEPSSRKQRTDTEYEIEALAKGLKVLEALQDCATLAIQTRRVQLRTGLPYDFCMRALKTLKLAGFVAEVEDGWKLTPRLNRILKFENATATHQL
jgi:DNA-binding IclR family transcriptional regulator